MYKVVGILLFFSCETFADVPECPFHSNKRECLLSVEEEYKNFLDFIEEEYVSPKEELIQAANDVKHFESLACQRTCLY